MYMYMHVTRRGTFRWSIRSGYHYDSTIKQSSEQSLEDHCISYISHLKFSMYMYMYIYMHVHVFTHIILYA